MVQSKDELSLLTLNTHSLMQPDNEMCFRELVHAIREEQVDVIALQEVNQSEEAPLVSDEDLKQSGFYNCGFSIRRNNYAYTLTRMLREEDSSFTWSWMFAHMGYDTFEEGLAILCRGEMSDVIATQVSPPGIQGARVILTGILSGIAFSSIHFGWWGDERDPFVNQWHMASTLFDRVPMKHYLLGDFNNPSHKRGEGYDLIISSGWRDCYTRALDRDSGVTVGGMIDGWCNQQVDPMRIDLVFSSTDGVTLSSKVIFNGTNRPVISDHFGVITKEKLR